MTTVTTKNGRKFTFNLIYFQNEFGEPRFFFHWNISLDLSNQKVDF